MFKVGELVKRNLISNNPKAVCVIVNKSEHNYTVYNNSLKCLHVVAISVMDGLYSKVVV
jgi:hypothetical protein